MSYGVILKNGITSASILSDEISYYPSTRNGYSTSDVVYFETIGFTDDKIYITFDQYGNLINTTANYPNGIDLNSLQSFASVKNLSNPTVVKLATIAGYETGLANTVYNSNIQNGNIVLSNFSNPSVFYEITSITPSINTKISSSSFIINNQYFKSGNFGYVSDGQGHLFLITFPNNSSIPTWIQLPEEKFYWYPNYYLTYSGIFDGKKINLNLFNKIVPKATETILINCTSNDSNSGLYSIAIVSDYVYVKKTPLLFNYPGQIFSCKINLDTSSNMNYYPVVYYVPYEYGSYSNPFSKPLLLTLYNPSAYASPSYFCPVLSNSNITSSFILPLVQMRGLMNKTSDIFKVGVFVSNFVPDNSTLITMLQYTIYNQNDFA